jgi:eukaryotic-like serine/threonine-protein kinase
MGAVYHAWDDELGVALALKVIRPEVSGDPEAAHDIERRFKRELLLARQVTHKNVVRIHDLGEIDGIKYITMPYIQGADLAASLRREGKFPVSKVLAIARQVADGLAAAHDASVVHRDLKPANIMIDEDDRAIIMDFGIAQPAAGLGGRSMAGVVVGTLDYMAPEQAMGQAVDHRADIYAFGLILYDLLLGGRPSTGGESAIAQLMVRLQRSLPPVRTIDPSIPEGVEAIIARCTELDPSARFQHASEIVAALDRLDREGLPVDPTRPDTTSHRTRPGLSLPIDSAAAKTAANTRRALGPALVAAAIAGVLAIGGGAYLVLHRSGGTTSSQATGAGVSTERVSIAVLPFHNRTGEASLDWIQTATAEMLKGAVPSERIHTVSSDRVFQVLRDLRVSPDADIDAGTMKRIADFSNSDVVVSGEYAQVGGQLQFRALLKRIADGSDQQVTATVADQQHLADAISALNEGIQQHLLRGAVATTGVAPVKPSSQSVEALRLYSEGVEFGRRGNHLEAVKRFEGAVKADPRFALAYSKLAQTYANIGHDADAERASRSAVEQASNLPEREKHLVNAVHASILHDQTHAIEEYENLLRIAPDDPEVRFSLANRYEQSGAFDRARTNYLKVLETDPKYFEALYAAGRVEILRKNPNGALDYLNRALSVAIQLDNDEGRASALNAIGVAYKRLGKPADAQRYYAEALELRKRIGDKRGMAATLNELGNIERTLGKLPDALVSFRSAIDLRREINDKRGVASSLNDIGLVYQSLGRYDEALSNYKEALQLQTELGNADYQALALEEIGSTYFLQARYDDAASYLDRALQVRQKLNVGGATAIALRLNADLRARTGQYDQAVSQYLKALELSRESGSKLEAARNSLGLGLIFEQQGRYRAALDARNEALKALRDNNDKGADLVEALGATAVTWALLGRQDQLRALLEEADKTSQNLADGRARAQTLTARGKAALLAGNADAVSLLTDAAQKATASGDRYLTLETKLNLAAAQLQAGRPQPVTATAKATAAEATKLGLKYLAAESAVISAEALIAQKSYQAARSTLDDALTQAERLGARSLLLRAHHALATVLRATRQPAEADSHAREAARLLGELRKEAGDDAILRRPDLAEIAAAPAVAAAR